MNNILIIGAGRSSGALIRYVLEKARDKNWFVTVADADPKLGAVLAPYPLWCSFATVMSAEIWRLNR